MPILVHVVLVWIAALCCAAVAHLAAPAAPAAHAAPAANPVVVASVVLTLLLVATSIVAAVYRRWPRMPALYSIGLAGLLIGDSAARRQAACTRVLASQPVLRIALDERAAPGRRITGQATGISPGIAHCAVRAVVRVNNGRAPPGAIVTVSAPFQATQRGLRVESDIVPTAQVDRLRAWRGTTGERIDALFGANASLVRALLIADQDGIAPEVRDRFADAGLVHLLSISGLHVAIIASALLTLATAMRLPRGWATIAALSLVACYVIALGAPAPAVRSAVMLATISISERWQRPVHAWTALALGAALPTIQPAVVLDLGYQLSVSGMAALVAARSLLRRARHDGPAQNAPAFLRVVRRRIVGLRGWRWWLARESVTGVIATLVTAPLIAWTFGRVSLIAPLSNLAAGPVVVFLQPALFLAMLLSP